jgi:DeoR family transcriptional regulator, suf operon transcriptional repressor
MIPTIPTKELSTKQDILQVLLKQGEVSASSIAQSLHVTPQAIRRHLKDLEEEGLIQHKSVQTGMGRPNHLYELSKKGRSQFPDRSDEFAVSLLGSLSEQVGPEQMDLILRMQWERKAIEYRDRLGEGSLKSRVEALVELRKSEGYMAESHVVDESQASPQYVLTEYHCAISHIAETFPNVCGHELEMFAIALSDCQVERTHWLVDGEHRCGYLIQGKG